MGKFPVSLAEYFYTCFTKEAGSGYLFVMYSHSHYSSASFCAQYFRKPLLELLSSWCILKFTPCFYVLPSTGHTAAGQQASSTPPSTNGSWLWTRYVKRNPWKPLCPTCILFVSLSNCELDPLSLTWLLQTQPPFLNATLSSATVAAVGRPVGGQHSDSRLRSSQDWLPRFLFFLRRACVFNGASFQTSRHGPFRKCLFHFCCIFLLPWKHDYLGEPLPNSGCCIVDCFTVVA
jgi:hypothetical protein